MESLKNRLEALASPQVVAAFNSSDEAKAKFFVKIFNGMERGSQLLKYFRKCLKARLIKDWEKIVEDNQHLGVLEWCGMFFAQLEQTIGNQVKIKSSFFVHLGLLVKESIHHGSWVFPQGMFPLIATFGYQWYILVITCIERRFNTKF